MRVIAVIREEEHRPDDQDDRVDLEVLVERKEAGGEALRRRERHDDVTDVEGREKRGGSQAEVDQVDDPRDESRFLLQHSIVTVAASMILQRSKRLYGPPPENV